MNTLPNVDLVLPEIDHEERARCAAWIAELKADLSTLEDPQECLYVHASLVDFCALMGEPCPSLETAAPLMRTQGEDFAKLRAQVEERRRVEAVDVQRHLNFVLAKVKVDCAIATYGEDSAQACLAISKAIQFLPAAELEKLDAAARELGLMPKAAGYTADDRPVFAAADIAAHFGMDESEVIASMDADPSLTVDAASVQRVQ